jgi:hypothetical protein
VDPTYIGEETNHAGLFAPARTTVVSSRERTFEASRCIVTYPKKPKYKKFRVDGINTPIR